MSNRRKFIVALGAVALVAPFASYTQQEAKVWRIGFLAPRRPDDLATDVYSGFPQGMRALGYIEGRNLVIEWRYADGVLERLPDLAAELVWLKVDVIVTGGTPAARAAQTATSTIPIVMGSIADPVGAGLVKSLARPDGNITGVSNVDTDLSPKRLELLLAMVPKRARVAVLMDPNNSSHRAILQTVQATAQKTAVKLLPVEVRAPQEIETAFSVIAREKVDAVMLFSGGFFNEREIQIAELMAKRRLPSISSRAQYAEAGGLLSYGTNNLENYRRAAYYVDRILKGRKPGDLPIEQGMTFELVVNMKTAKALGLTMPPQIMVQATRVIQ